MEITEEDAWVILGAIEIATLERGLYNGEKALIRKIKGAFPEIARTVDEKELRERLWDRAHDDPEVQALYREVCEQDAWELELGEKFFAAKERVFERLMEGSGREDG